MSISPSNSMSKDDLAKKGLGGAVSPPMLLDDDERNAKRRSEGFSDVDESAVRAEGEEKVTGFVWGLIAAAAIAGLLFGSSPSNSSLRWAGDDGD
jgi:hypothetical protein